MENNENFRFAIEPREMRVDERKRERLQREEERGWKKKNGKCKCIDTCENCKFGVGINNGRADGERTRGARLKIIENRGRLRNSEENKNSETKTSRRNIGIG